MAECTKRTSTLQCWRFLPPSKEGGQLEDPMPPWVAEAEIAPQPMDIAQAVTPGPHLWIRNPLVRKGTSRVDPGCWIVQCQNGHRLVLDCQEFLEQYLLSEPAPEMPSRVGDMIGPNPADADPRGA